MFSVVPVGIPHRQDDPSVKKCNFNLRLGRQQTWTQTAGQGKDRQESVSCLLGFDSS